MLKMLTTHALVCDGDNCAAYFVPSGHYDVTDRVDSVILSDAVHATRGAAAAGWAIRVEDEHRQRLHLCPSCAKGHAGRHEAAHQKLVEQLDLGSCLTCTTNGVDQ